LECSGSTGKPKGVLHTTAGYMIYAATTFKYVFDYHQGDIYWCTADIGWITGHTYVTYGPLANGATSVIVCLIQTQLSNGNNLMVLANKVINNHYYGSV